jgi:hypothetical protein
VELTEPKAAVERAGGVAKLVSLVDGEIQAMNADVNMADTFPVDLALDTASVDEFDALVLPGGTTNPDRLRQDGRAPHRAGPAQGVGQKGVAMKWFPRLLGLATAGYGAAILVRPRLMTGPCELSDDAASRVLTRAVGSRDMLSGLAMLLAGSPSTLRLAIAVRVGSDLGDAVVFGACLPTVTARRKAAAVASAWAALCALSALTVRS